MTENSADQVVMVLLSTYNGCRYLKQQLDSLYQQDYPNVHILVRDDGSSDATKEILIKEQTKGRLNLLQDHENQGVTASFFELLRYAAAKNADFVAFCDQDDVWHADKLTRAISNLSDVMADQPAMYCSRVEIVNADLKHLGYTMLPKEIGFGNALVDCIATGCTIVLNNAAVRLLSTRLPNSNVMHDWWCYLAISCLGKIIYDSTATLKYRQHDRNVIGLAENKWIQFVNRWRRFFGGSNGHLRMSAQAMQFMTIFQDRIPPNQHRLLTHFIKAKSSWRQRVRLALSSDIWRQNSSDNMLLRLLILLNRF